MDSKDLAEFVIDLADKNRTMEAFRKSLIENGADFSGGLMRSLFDLVNRMRSLAGQSSKVMEEALEKASDPKLVAKRSQFSGLAIPDDFGRANELLDVGKEEKNEFEGNWLFLLLIKFSFLNFSSFTENKPKIKKNKMLMILWHNWKV